ncbi:autotransporter assembly complex protein TamA [Brevundimonas variabilis]|uniref:Translocation and assembly module TamA n=1 Tax=Brevundimonas variabilis TaxID=74312 RepID=A0A7W9FFY5_9CAUL|nr:translocation and assembly module TamA [Brevundimonas variabilis]
MTSAATTVVIIMLGLASPFTAVADPRAQVRGELDGPLRTQIERAIGEVDGPPANRFEARRRARAAMESAEALLRSEGYYQSTLEDLVEGDTAPVAIITVIPGQRFLIAPPAIRYIAPEPDPATAAEVAAEIDLQPGSPGRSVDVIAAEGRIVASLTRRGYADAETQPRRVVVDHAAYTVQPTYAIVSGELVRLDGVRLETRGPTNPDWVAALAPWVSGEVYDPEDVAELERRLLETGVYDGVGVALSPIDQTTVEGNRPVIVSLTDRPRRILEAGITASTATASPTATAATLTTAGGSGIDALWTWYNRFGRADTLRFEARLTDLDSRLGVNLSLPHWRRPGQTLALATAIVNEDTDAYRRLAFTAAADLRQRLGRTSYYSYGVGLDAGQYDESRFDPITQAPIDVSRNLAILTARGAAFMDRSNDALNPTSGYRFTANVQPTAVTGEDSLLFLKAETQVTAYLPVQDDAKTVLAGRIKLGSIVGGEELTIPADRLFYSGGGGSVRGFEYQGVGPRLPDNTPRGGLSLFEVSAEVRRDIGESFQAVAFVDAGAIGSSETPDFSNLRYAVGAGVRYKLPFGPVRFDIAMPLDKREGDAAFQIYISIGQAF